MLKVAARYLFVASIAGALVFLALTLAPVIRTENAAFRSCRINTTSECLTDLGVDLALTMRSPPGYMREVDMLAQMGRLGDAYKLELRSQQAKDQPQEDAERAANRRLASHRISEAIRSGENLQHAVERTPSVDPGVLWISALDLLGRNPYDASAKPALAPDEHMLAVVPEMAAMIAAMARNETERPRTNHLVYSAELQAALGNRAKVIHLLEHLPKNEGRSIVLTEELMRLIGSETALRLCNEAGGSSPHMLLTAASAEAVPARSAAYLERAYREFSDKKPWPDFNWMARTVRLSTEIGHDELALRLAADLALQAQTRPSALPAFPHIDAASALMAAKAGEVEVRRSLSLAEHSLPRSNRIVGIGFVSGLISWESSGLDAAARRKIANVRGHLGEVEAALQMMDGIDEPVFAWTDMLTPDIPLEHLNSLLDAAGAILPPAGFAYVRAQLAQEMTRESMTEPQRSWARSTATDILRAKLFVGDRGVAIYTSLAKIGVRLKDPSIESLALTGMAQSALASRAYGDLISAGFFLYQSDITP